MIDKNDFCVTSRMTYFGEKPRKERNTLIAWLTFDKIAYTTYCISCQSQNCFRPTLGWFISLIYFVDSTI